jgi:hypothetical protein
MPTSPSSLLPSSMQLKSKGIDVKPGTVATTLSQYRKKLGMPARRGKRKGRAAAVAGRRGRQPSNGSVTAGNTGVAEVLEALRLIKQASALVGVDGCRVLLAETEMGS